MRFEKALDEIRNNGGILVVCDVLPRRGLGADWLSRATSELQDYKTLEKQWVGNHRQLGPLL